MFTHASRRRGLIATTALAVAASPLALGFSSPAAANPAGTGLVIQEVYGAGGNSGATYNADFVELFNPTVGDIALTGMSIQYRSAASAASTSDFDLTGSVPAGETYLIQMSNAGATGAALPTPDATAAPQFLMSGTDGQVLLNATTTAFAGTGDVAGNAALVDMVGYGDGATTFEGAPTGVDLSSTTSAQRAETGADSDDNADDFSEQAPSPGTIPDDPDNRTIAEIQGTGAASPLDGDYVRTSGVVTARYPTGGYDGFYIQTGGTPATAGASDGLFVYAPDLANTAWPPLGASVEVVGDVSEFNGTTEVTLGSLGPAAAQPAVVPLAIPWTGLDSDTEKESHEGELIAPQGDFTVTDSFDIDNYAEIGLASGDKPLISPTDVADAQGTEDEAVAADNAARKITLDDGASINFREAANSDTPYPWLTPTNPIRVGAPVTFTGNVVLEFRNSLWKFQPTRRVTGAGSNTATFENTRTAAPEEVGGDLRLATFNVLNYFPTTGEEFDATPGTTCTFFTDRDGNRTTVNSCNPNGPRGAANAANLARQQSKIVKAINALDASVVSLEELENSAKFGKDRDFAISTLVTALNADAGAGTWAFAPSPAAGDRPTPAQEDVIRTGFIYKPADVELVGASKILIDEVNFDNAREPLAQVFKPVGGSDANEFVVIVNHFKSKGSGTPDPDGQGNANEDREGQATALSAFADSFAADRGVEAVFLAGDFNAYTQEDPMQILYDDDYVNLESTTDPGEASYSFDGMSGSLDHVLANAAAESLVTGVDIWNINAEEAVAYEYSRYNSNETLLFDGSTPYKASDHNPEVVGLDFGGFGPEEIQILGTNDFHGRILNNVPNPPSNPAGGPEAGAAVLSGAVKQLREENPNTVFAAAGDLIGASTFESFIQQDEPTIDALNEAGLEVSAAGNHEFDKGYADLVGRVQDRADWEYIAANVRKKLDNRRALAPTFTKTLDGVKVGFVGAVTEHLPELVAPDGISEIKVTDIVDEVNTAADDLRAGSNGADIVVLLVHEGAPSTDCATMDDDPTSDFGSIINGVNGDVDAIISGHTHLEYNCSFPVAEWADRPVKERPVVSAGQYGIALNQLVFTVDGATGEVLAKTQEVLKLKANPATPNYPSDPAVEEIVADAVAVAEVEGAKELGQIEDEFSRAKLSNGTTENRGGESTLGNLVAEIQQWATESPTTGSAQIAFMNPGGLRADLLGNGTTSPRTVTFRQAAEVQPFANTLVNMDLTGAQIESVLEEQWQAAGASRPFLRLGISEGFTYTYTPPPAGSPSGTKGEVTGMWLDGEPIVDATTYSVTVNSFLASGGDGFATLNQGTGKQDTGQTDLEAQVDYFAEFASEAPLPVDYSQRSVGATFPAGAPATYEPGDNVGFDLSSLSMTGPNDVRDTEVAVSLDGEELGTFPVTTTIQPALPGFDEAGTASVDVTLPADTPAGQVDLVVTGASTGTSVQVPIEVAGVGKANPRIERVVKPNPVKVNRNSTLIVKISADGVVPTGTVKVTFPGGKGTKTKDLENGRLEMGVPKFGAPGVKEITIRYLGDDSVEAKTVTYDLRVQR